jgi:hypothetical protein
MCCIGRVMAMRLIRQCVWIHRRANVLLVTVDLFWSMLGLILLEASVSRKIHRTANVWPQELSSSMLGFVLLKAS